MPLWNDWWNIVSIEILEMADSIDIDGIVFVT